MNPPASTADPAPDPHASIPTSATRPDGTWADGTRSAADADARARRLIAARRWQRRAELAARRAARASSAVR